MSRKTARRNFLKNTLYSAGTLIAVRPAIGSQNNADFKNAFLATSAGNARSNKNSFSPAASTHPQNQACAMTPKQSLGPFYPGEKNFSADFDLTQIPGSSERASGQIIYVTGKVVDSECRPIVGANVEIWQACSSGRYNHPNDPNDAPMDPHFRYWSEAFTDSEGRYAFKTIVPGAYPADSNWIRPPHIHFKISKLGYRDLVTQMYFEGEPLNDSDLILNELPEGMRRNLITRFTPSSSDFEPNSLTGFFSITLMKVRS